MSNTTGPINPAELATDLDEIADAARDAIDVDDDEVMADVLTVIAQLDPVEVLNGTARWTKSQQTLIVDAQRAFGDISKATDLVGGEPTTDSL